MGGVRVPSVWLPPAGCEGVRRPPSPDRRRHDVVGEKALWHADLRVSEVAKHLRLGHGGNCSVLRNGLLSSTYSTGRLYVEDSGLIKLLGG